jgi:DNA invertase Pin-like site-specific DNA recombinase
MSVIGYVSIWAGSQDLSFQEASLWAAGCDTIYVERFRDVIAERRKELGTILQILQDGDVLIVPRIRCIAGNIRSFRKIARRVNDKGASLKAIEESVDTAIGKDFFDALDAVVDFLESMRRETTFDSLVWTTKHEDGPLTTPCWIVQGRPRNPGGYISLTFKGKQTTAHRAMYELAFGPFDPGLVVRHRCDRPDCVNPSHLDIGTAIDNVADRMARRCGLWRQRQLEGIAKAKAGGAYKGRPASINAVRVREMKAQGLGATAIAKALGIGRASVYRVV